MSNIVQIKVPDIGDFKEVEVIEVLVSVGDTIKAEQSLITVESDKASMEIPTSQGGVVKSISVKVGDKVAEGTVVLEVEAAGAAAPPRPPPRPLLLRRPRPLKLPSLPLLPRRLRLPAPVPSRSRCRTSATSRKSRSSKSWSPWATRSRPSRA